MDFVIMSFVFWKYNCLATDLRNWEYAAKNMPCSSVQPRACATFLSTAKSVCHFPWYSQECVPRSSAQPSMSHPAQCSREYATFRNLELSGAGSCSSGWPNASGYSRTSCWWLRATHAICGKEQNQNPRQRLLQLRERKCCIQGRSGQAEGSSGQKGKNSKPQHQGGGNSTSKWQHPEGEGKYNCDKSGVSNRKSQSKTINCTHSKRKGKKSDHYQKVNQDGLYNQNVEE